MERIHQYDPELGSFQAWLAVLSRSRSLDRLRKKKPLLVEDIGVLYQSQATGERTEEKAIRRLEQEVAEEAILRLPDLQRQAIERFYFESKTHKELAEELGRPLGTIKSLLRYGLKNVRKQMSQVGWLEVASGEPKR
ncbi:MAG: sigma-70 family RNA polymerase sigma factor [Thermicanus sp.]|nr:sigma-70 family RNA polymerase sigma factor [Thermicanus sp.]